MHEDKRIIVDMIGDYAEEHFFEPQRNWPPWEFQKRSYERWAIAHMIGAIIQSDDEPEAVIRRTLRKVRQCKSGTDLSKSGAMIMSAMEEMATDILDIIRSYRDY